MSQDHRRPDGGEREARQPDQPGHEHADLVRATHAPTPADLTDYFTLCLACHFASVATYVPTDVDAKIRHALWLDQTDADELARMRELALSIAQWDTSGVSTRAVTLERPGGRVERHSGHDGEWLSVLCGGLVGHSKIGDATNAARFEEAIDAELAREAHAFDEVACEKGREIALAGLAAILTHNVGDVMQVLAIESTKNICRRPSSCASRSSLANVSIATAAPSGERRPFTAP